MILTTSNMSSFLLDGLLKFSQTPAVVNAIMF